MNNGNVDIVSLLSKSIKDQSTVIRDLKRLIWVLAHRTDNEITIQESELIKITNIHSAELQITHDPVKGELKIRATI